MEDMDAGAGATREGSVVEPAGGGRAGGQRAGRVHDPSVFRVQEPESDRGYLAAIKYFHKMFAGWELPTSHCMVVAVGKGIDRAHGKSEIKPRVRKPLSWDLLLKGKSVLQETGEGGVVWMGLALSYFLLCRASEMFAYANGLYI